MRVGELVEKARLADPRLADNRRHLPTAVASELLGAAELLHLGIAADEASQPAPGGCLQTSAYRARARHLVDLHRLGQPLYRARAERLDRNVALGARQRPGRGEHPAGIVEL